MDESEDDVRSSGTSSSAASSAAWGVLGAASRNKADAFLDEQIEVVKLEKEKLEKEDLAIDAEIALNLSHLRFRRLGDFTKLTLESAGGLLVIVVLIALATVAWQAAGDRSLIIDSFRVPPDMAAKGLTGEVVANALLDHLVQLQDQTDSSRAPETYASDWGGDIKVEIPETGISISEAYRVLVGWLGHRTHITGEVYHSASGIALVARVGGHAGVRFEGRESDLDALVSRAADSVYHETQPYRYAILVESVRNELTKGEALLKDLALNGDTIDLPWAYSVWGESVISDDNVPLALALTHKGYELAPELPLMSYNAAQIDAVAAHDEDELRMVQIAERSLAGSGASMITARSASVMGPQSRATIEEETGDFLAAAGMEARALDGVDYEGSHLSAFYMLAADLALAHDLSGSRKALGRGTDVDEEQQSAMGYGWTFTNFVLVQFAQLAESGDWKAARAHLEEILQVPIVRAKVSQASNRTQLLPWLALAEANTGDLKAALAEIGRSPLDCYLCLRLRGQIDVIAGNRAGAEYWFARAVAVAPSIPFAYADWGAMLLHEGQYAAAVAKFKDANTKGPRFADPLELWGEALMQENRSDLALAKFEEANKYAPNWGRLHLEWGKALTYAGEEHQAKKQFAAAAGLELSSADTSDLARWTARRK